jgi:hypothetical protein
VIEVCGAVVSGAASTVQVRLAGVASVLPAASVARAEKVCAPAAREPKEVGEAQSPQGRESSEHSKLELASLEEKLKLALVEVVVAGGPESIEVLGGVVSPDNCTVHPRVAGVGSALPAVSTARTETVWLPSAKEEKDSDSAHAFQEAESSLHSKLEPFSVEEKSKFAVVAMVVPDGPETIDVLGGVVSPRARTVQVRLAAEASVFPAESVALTWKVCEPTVSELYSLGELQAPQAPESSLHSKLEPLSLAEKPKLAAVAVVVAGGPERIVVLGAVVSASADGLVSAATTAAETAWRIPAELGTLARSRGFEPANTSAPSPSPSPSVS